MSKMRGSQEAVDVVEDVELEADEAQLSKLRRQYRMMERNKAQYRDEAVIVLTKQRKLVSELQTEKKMLEDQLSAAQNKYNENRDTRAKSSLSSILDRQQEYEDLIYQLKEKVTSLDNELKMAEKKIRDTRRRVPSARRLQSRRENAEAVNNSINNRIQQTTVKLNSVLAENSNQRITIDNLLKDRDKFLIQVQRLEEQLALMGKKRSEVMDQVTHAYTERDEAQNKMKGLKDRVERDTHQYNLELKKLQRALDHQSSLKSFVNTIAAGEDDDSRKYQDIGDHGGLEQTLMTYRASISHLEESSGETSAETLVSNYLQTENDNYTLFSYITGLNNEVTSISAEVRRLRQNVEEMRLSQKQSQREAEDTKDNLENHLVKLEQDRTVLKEEVERAETMLVDLKKATIDLFELFQCDPTPVWAVIGTKEVTNSNISVYVSVIEQRVQDLYQLLHVMHGEDIADIPGIDATPDTGSETASGHSSSKTPLPFTRTPLSHGMQHSSHSSEDDTMGPISHSDLLFTMRDHITDAGND